LKPESIAVAPMPGANAALRRDYARCASITRRSSSNFYYAFMLLPAERRQALYAVYAFCRFVDDIADGQAAANPAELLTRWREELERVFNGSPAHPISRALADNVRRFAIPRRYFEEIIDGVEMDLGRARYAAFQELRLYCYRVASAVGLVCIEIFGYRNPCTREYAENLGIAFQLTNIIRDLSEDAARGRIYLPLEDLARFGVTEDEILRGRDTLELRRLLEFEVERARSFYALAERALPAEDRSAMVCAEAMRSIYRALLERIASKGCGVVGRRHRISTPRKLYLVGRTWAGTRLRTRKPARDG
jgi:phytoene synthase